MSEANGARASKGLRTILATLAGATYTAGQAGGYDYGVDTTLGVDAGLLRDLIAFGLAMAATFWPQASKVGGLFKGLSTDPRVSALQKQVAKLEARLTLLENGIKS